MEQATLFETIPSDTLFSVVQFISANPHSEPWLSKVQANDVIPVLMSGGVLSAAARHLFRDLQKMYHYGGWEEENRDMFWNLANIMAPYAESLPISPPILRMLNCNQFRALRVLKIYRCSDVNAMQKIFMACDGNLRELGLHYMNLEQRMIRSIARHCESIEVLDLCKLSYEGTLGRIWRTLKGNLRELKGVILEKEFVHIARHCTQIETLQLHDDWERIWSSPATFQLLRAQQMLRVLIISLSSLCLNAATLSNFDNVNHICKLRRVLPPDLRVHCDLEFYESDSCLNYIRIFSLGLRKLSIRCHFNSFPSDLLPLLDNLEDFSLEHTMREDPLSVMESWFGRRMPNLRKLSINGPINANILSALAQTTSSLFDFEYYVSIVWRPECQLPVKALDFLDFLEANKCLERINIVFSVFLIDFPYADSDDRLGKQGLDEFSNFIPQLRFLTKLREVVLESNCDRGIWSPKISNACVSLRNKGRSVTVNGIRYLPPP